ncbi:MAG: fructose-6-phosphate aldolase [Leptolyngbya sp.]|nr:fructose-6-phosphate aldolase [Candidatus Melainabacteria bacterium]
MLLFLDTANVEEIKEINAWGVLSGITTNPTLIVKEGKDFKKVVKEICNIVDGPVSAEVTATDAEGMIKQGLDIATWADNVVVKCPLTEAGLQATAHLSKKDIKVNVTLCFSANQALLAARAGAYFISPFVGRLDDINQDGCALVEEIVELYHMQAIETRVLAASIRTPQQVTRCAIAGADVATLPFKVFKMLVKHPLTDAGLTQFLKDWEKVTAEQPVAAKK